MNKGRNMSNSDETDLAAMLESGWAVAGYSTCLSQLGIITHHVLLQKGSNLTTFVVAQRGKEEDGRGSFMLSPAPPPKKKGSWFG